VAKSKSLSQSGKFLSMLKNNKKCFAFFVFQKSLVFEDLWFLTERFKYLLYLQYLQVSLLTIRYSKHARERMVLRGITEKEVEEGIKRGSKELQKPNKILSHYKYFCVVYRKIKDNTYVITIKPR